MQLLVSNCWFRRLGLIIGQRFRPVDGRPPNFPAWLWHAGDGHVCWLRYGVCPKYPYYISWLTWDNVGGFIRFDLYFLPVTATWPGWVFKDGICQKFRQKTHGNSLVNLMVPLKIRTYRKIRSKEAKKGGVYHGIPQIFLHTTISYCWLYTPLYAHVIPIISICLVG